jgi:hypothetical protein
MENARWLKVSKDGITFPNFDRHNGKPAKERCLSQRRMLRNRYAATVTTPSPEKRREEKNIIPPKREEKSPPKSEPEPDESQVADEPLATALESLDRWSSLRPPVGRGSPCNAANDLTAVRRLVDACSQATPIIQNGEQVRRHLLIPHAVEMLIAQSKPFKNTAFACGCVRNELDEWANQGPPKDGNGARDAPNAAQAALEAFWAKQEKSDAEPRNQGSHGPAREAVPEMGAAE